jgi:HlyD family secretion protein
MKKIFTLLILAGLGAGGWYAYQQHLFGLGTPVAQVGDADQPTARVEVRSIDYSVQVSGDVMPQFQLEVKPEVGGKLKELYVQPGDTVKEGQLLVEIDDRDIITEKESAKTEVEGARVQVERMEKNYARSKELFSQKLVSIEAHQDLESDLAMSKNTLERSERKVQLVEDKLRKTKVSAPSDGTVLTVPVIPGQVTIAAASVNNGTTLMTIANLDKLLVECHVNQVDVSKLRSGQSVKLRAESIKDGDMTAQIFFIAPIATIKNNIKGFTVRALIQKPSTALRPGMTVNLAIPIERADDALSVPVNAVFRGEGNNRVVFVRNGEKTEKREVKIGVTNIEHAEILNGLKQGEEILLFNPERVARKRTGA